MFSIFAHKMFDTLGSNPDVEVFTTNILLGIQAYVGHVMLLLLMSFPTKLISVDD